MSVKLRSIVFPALLPLLGAGLLAAGCGSSGNAGTSGSAGSSGGGGTTGRGGSTGTGAGGTSSTGSGGSSSTGAGGTSPTGTGGSSATGTGGSTDGGYDGPSVGVDGGGKLPVGMTQCSDGIDNDGDGKVDYNDPECVGPLDNDESTFATGIPGDNMDACKQDCFFDGNSGAGDDGCDWQLKCDPLSTNSRCPYDQQYAQQHANECSLSSSQSQECVTKCRRLVPNGCDCFGCCAVPGVATPIKLAATCTAAAFNDPTKCPPCTQVTQCNNPCDRCELCIGKTTVPADCGPGGADGGTTDGGSDGGTHTCGSDYQACGPGTSIPIDGCPEGYGCITGCCYPLEIVP